MKAANNFYVYAYFRLDGTPCYVGKGKGERWRHRGKYGRNCHFLNIRAKAKREGFDLPCTKLIEGLTEPEAMQIEADLIRLVGRKANGGPLVNLTDGWEGASGYVWTAEQREAHGAKRRGRKHSAEWCAAISATLKGRPKSSQHIANASAARRGVINRAGWWSTPEGRIRHAAGNPGHTGHKHTDETKKSIRLNVISVNIRKAVVTSPTWAERNSVRYPVAA